MSFKRWALCLMSSMLCFGIIAGEGKGEKKSEEMKAKKEEKKESKKEEKKDEKKEANNEVGKIEKDGKNVALPEPIFKAFHARFKTATVLEVKERADSLEISAKDEWNDKLKVVYGTDAKLWSESSHKLPLSAVPAAVVDTAKKWAPAAKWDEVAEVSTKKGEAPVYEISGDLNGKNIKADIAEDGKVVKASKLPEEKAAKKEEKKEEKKETKKEEKKHDHKDHKHDEKKEEKKSEEKK
jgi:hypothetical protein